MNASLWLILLLLLFPLAVEAHEISIRYGNRQNKNEAHGLFDITPSANGKILQLAYTYLPWGDQKTWLRNFYVEAGGGVESDIDFGSITSSAFEFAPGARVLFGSFKVWISHGFAYFPQSHNKPAGQFATRLGLGFVDPLSGVTIGLERSHYSTGSTNSTFHGNDYVGLTLSVPIHAKKME